MVMSASPALHAQRYPRIGLWIPAWIRKRGSVKAFIDGHTWQWEGTMAVLTVAYVVLAFLDDEMSANIPDAVMVSLAAIFIGEFSLRLWDSEDRLRYIRRHWVDAITAIPLLGPLRGLRLLKLLRIGAVLRTVAVVDSKVDGARRVSLWFLGLLLVVIWLSASYAFWVLEHGTNPDMNTATDAMYLAFVSICTLGFGDAHAVSFGGRILGGVLIFFALGFVGMFSTQITMQLLRQKDAAAVVEDEVRGLRDEISVLSAVIEMHFQTLQSAGNAEDRG